MTVVAVKYRGKGYVYISQALATYGMHSHVEVHVQAPPQIVTDTIVHNIQDESDRYSFTPNNRKVRLSLATQAH
jgi:hypothetical protein